MAASVFNSWVIKPGTIAREGEILLSPPKVGLGREGKPVLKDVVDAISNILNWYPYLASSLETAKQATKLSSHLNPISQGLALFQFGTDISRIPHAWDKYWEKDEGGTLELVTHGLAAVNSGTDGVMFFDSNKIYSLGEWAKGASAAFWGSTGLLSCIDLFSKQIKEVEDFAAALRKETDPKVKALREDKLGLAYLKVLKDITTIALASLMLVSLAFASVAAHVFFSPITLGLSSTWFALHFINHFYEAALNTREGELRQLGKMI